MRDVDVVAAELLGTYAWATEKREGTEHLVPGQQVAEPAAGDEGEMVVVHACTAPNGHDVLIYVYAFEGTVPYPEQFRFRGNARGWRLEQVPSGFLAAPDVERLVREAKLTGGRVTLPGRSWTD